ncbi:DUF4139 domain-containing protein [Sulfurovum sp.]|uniref:DUF4139 domain-containing protein n=1 Tax=Sulfurovum sp. TaxID=1969726 RepID=UPI0025CE4417|nr:DUF4139 domain-containing protein [Sulfurovum sp.]
MKLSISTLSLLLLAGSMADASSLAVYQDQTIYDLTPKDNYIGFAKGVKVKCEGNTVALETMYDCPADKRLCKELLSLKETQQKLIAIQANTKVLDEIVSLPRPTTFDAGAWIESARLIGTEKAALLTKAKKASEALTLKESAFKKQAPSKKALALTQRCPKELELTIPYGYVSFSTAYEADMLNDEEMIKVTQYLSVTNRSGIDIEADTAMFYYRSAHQYVNPIHFNPWIVRKYEPGPVRTYRKSMMKEANLEMMAADEENAGSMPMAAPVASYEDAREYKIQDLTLPSTGVPLNVEVLSWKAPLKCEVRAYPYVSSRAFYVCAFKPKFQIDSNRWKIRSAKETINENAVGEYRDEHYNLYAKVEEDIQIQRKQIVQRARETGIFGGTARKKDGFVLTLTNKSDKPKALTLIDRIPTSTTEEIKVKLLKVSSDKKVDYKMVKDGKIEMKLILAANESKKIEVLFELSYDKDMKISY